MNEWMNEFLKRPFKPLSTQRRSQLQRGHCVGVFTPKRSERELWVKDLLKVPTQWLEAGFVLATYRSTINDATSEPPRPTK